ncbi:MAG: hypothetical protein EBU84_02955 [Actinobacteria bacterium]|nr:hypothetical protein [Actinomycetota bacterium]
MHRFLANVFSVVAAMTVSFVGMYDEPVAAPPLPALAQVQDTTTTTASTTTSTTTTTAPPSEAKPMIGRCPKFEPLFQQYGLEPVETFSYIAYRESRCRIKAVNARWDKDGNIVWTLNKDGSYDIGLLQINSTWKTVTRNICGGSIEMLYELDCNLRVAKYLLDNGGLGHWESMKP